MPYKYRERKNAYQRHWRAARKTAVLEGLICVQCGSNQEIELHHRNPEEKDSDDYWSRSWDYIWAEVSKCDPLCKTCHRQLHYGQDQQAAVEIEVNMECLPV